MGKPSKNSCGFGCEGDVMSKLEIDGETVGTLHYRIDDDNCFHIIWIDIMDKYRGKKYGNLLIEESIKRAKEKNCKSLKLEVLDSNLVDINLYKKYGFYIDKKDGYFIDMILNLK